MYYTLEDLIELDPEGYMEAEGEEEITVDTTEED